MTLNLQLDMFPKYYEEEQVHMSEVIIETKDRKYQVFGTEFCKHAIKSGKYGIPTIKPFTGFLPNEFITISELSSASGRSFGVTCFDYDYILERVWHKPEHYLKTLSLHPCMAEPDFSLKVGDPLAVQIANTFRNRALAFFFQEHGQPLIPAPAWSNAESYEFCFNGYSKGGWVMVSTLGTLKDERSKMFFKDGFIEMLQRISPDAVALYGDVNEELLSWMPKQLTIQHVVHNRLKRARRHGR